MSHPHPREVIDGLYAALRDKDMARAVNFFSDDIILEVPGIPGVGPAGHYTGHAGVRDCFRKLAEGHTTERMEFYERVHEGDIVVSRLLVEGVAKATGKRFKTNIIHHFTIKNGKVTYFRDFYDTVALVEAYGHKL